MKTNAKVRPILFSLLMALGMSFFMGVAMVIIKVGIKPQFLQMVLSEWLIGFAIAIIPSFILPPVIDKMLNRILKDS